MSEVVTATNGQQLDLGNLAQTINWSGGFVSSIVIVLNGVTYTQTFTNDGTNITAISRWVAS